MVGETFACHVGTPARQWDVTGAFSHIKWTPRSRTDDVQKELDDLVTSLVKDRLRNCALSCVFFDQLDMSLQEQKCREGDVALLREGLRALDSTSSSLQVQ